MKYVRFVYVLLLVVYFQTASAQQGENRKVGSFLGIGAAEGIDVFLKKGDQTSVRVETEGSTSPSDIITEVSGTYLKIHVRDASRLRNVHAKVYVTYTTLEKLSVSSAANVYSQGVIKTQSLQIGCSSAGSAELELEVGELEVNVSSAGDLSLKGRAGEINIDVSSAGEMDAYDLDADVVHVSASSGGSAKVSVLKELNAQASSGADIRFKGNPSKSRTDSSSGGSVKKSY
ncbi:MAG TPA: head GIN domain-containing protein [Cyclobacteriaceae bacterium]|nr:head GIN domain-containing protein [Cyclobacteriaceae bacterium]